MAVGKLSSRTSLGRVVMGHVAVVGRRLAEVVGQAANSCMAPGLGIPDPGARVHRDPLHGPTNQGDHG